MIYLIIIILFFIFLITYHRNLEFFRNGNVVVTLTTIPERLKSIFFKKVIDSLIKNKPDKIILNIPYVLKKNNEKYVIPKWLKNYKYKNIVEIHRCRDIGPATKFFYTIQRLEDDDIIVVVDDDIIYKDNMLKKLLDNVELFPENLICYNKDTLDAPMGYAGYAFKRLILKNIGKYYKNIYPCFSFDDNFIGEICRKEKVIVQCIGITEWDSLDKYKTDKHPKWEELCDSNKNKSITKCIKSFRNY